MKRFSLFQKALLSVLAVALPLFAAFLYVFSENQKHHLMEESVRDIAAAANGHEGEVYQFLEMARRVVQDFSGDGFIRESLSKADGGGKYDATALNRHLSENELPLYNVVKTISVISPGGRIVASTQSSVIGSNVSGEEFFLKGKESAGVTEGSDGETKVPVIIASAPVLSRNSDKKDGVVAAVIVLDDLNKVLTGEFRKGFGSVSGRTAGEGAVEAYIVNKDRRVIAGALSGKGAPFKGPVDTMPVKLCMDSGGQTSGIYKNHAGAEVAGASVCLPSMNWVLVAETGMAGVLARSNLFSGAGLITGIATALLAGVILVAFLVIVITPLRRMAIAAKDISEGRYGVELPVRPSDEIGALGAALNAMSREVKERIAAHKRSEERFRGLIEATSDWVWEVDENAVYTYASPKVRDILGYDPEEVLGKTPFDLMPPEEAARVSGVFGPIAASKSHFSLLENANIHKDGHLVVLETSGVPIMDENGKLLGYRGIDRDITWRKKAEDALRKSEEHLRKAQRTAKIGSWEWDIAADRITGSEELYRLLGIPGRGHNDTLEAFMVRVHPEDRAFVKGSIDAALHEGRPYNIDCRVLPGDGKETVLHAEGEATFDADGKANGMFGTVQDITERRAAEERIREAEEKFCLITENSIDAVLIADLETGRFVYANNAAVNLLGYGAEELLSMRTVDVIEPSQKDEHLNSLKRLSAGETVRTDRLVVKKDGTRAVVNASSFVIRSGGRVLAVAKLRDMTDYLKAREEIARLQEMCQTVTFAIPTAVILHDTELRVVFVNNRFSDITGIPREAIINKTPFEFLPPDVLKRLGLREKLAYVTENKAVWGPERITDRTPSGKELILSNTILPICADDGNLLYVMTTLDDVTEQARAEGSLAKSETHLKRAQRMAGLGSWEWDIAENRIIWSEELYRIFGLSPGEFDATYEAFIDHVHPDDRDFVKDSVFSALFKSGPYNITFRIVRPDGKEAVLHTEGEVTFDASGRPLLMFGTVQDITESRRLEEVHERLTAIVEAATDFIGSAGPDGRAFYLNRAARKMLGIGDDEDISRITVKDTHPEWANRIVAEEGIPAAIRDGSWSGETAFLSGDGQEIPVAQVILAHKSPEGRLLFFSTIARDITERKKAEAALMESTAMFRSVIDNSKAIIYIKDRDGRYILINRGCEIDLGIKNEDIRGRTDFDLFPGNIAAALHENDLLALGSKTPLEFEEQILRPDGMHTFISIKFPLLDPAGRPYAVCGISTDITERKRAEEELRLLATITLYIMEVKDFKAVIGFVLQRVCETAGWKMGEAWAPCRDSSALECVEVFCPEGEPSAGGMKKARMSEGLAFRPGEGLPGHVWVSKRTEWVRDIPEWNGFKSGLGIPVIVDGDVVAVLTFFMAEPRGDDARHVMMASGIAAQLGLAIKGKQADHELRVSEAKYRALVEQLPETTWIYTSALDDMASTLYVSPQIRSMGYSQEEWIKGRDLWHRHIHPEDRGRVLADFMRAREDGAPFRSEYRMLTREGKVRWFRDEAVVFKDEEGRPVCFQGVMQDITGRKQTEEEIRLLLTITQEISEARDFASAIEAVLSKVCKATGWCRAEAWVPRPDGAALEFFSEYRGGMETGRLTEESRKTVFPPGVGLPGRVWSSMRPEWVRDVSVNGSVFMRAESAMEAGLGAGFGIPIAAGDEVIAVLVFFMPGISDEDYRLTDLVSTVSFQLGSVFMRKKAEGALSEKTGELERLNKDLRGLTAAIIDLDERERKRFAEILHEGIGQNLVAVKLACSDCVKLRVCGDETRDTMLRMVSVLDETIHAVRGMTADLYPVPIEGMDLHDGVKWYIESFVGPKGIKAVLDLDKDLALDGDKKQVVFRIIRESLQNMLKYSSASEVEVGIKRRGGTTHVKVKDNGTGFDPGGVMAKPGRGFGLLLMSEWARSLGGRLGIRSRPGNGTEVTVEFSSEKKQKTTEGGGKEKE